MYLIGFFLSLSKRCSQLDGRVKAQSMMILVGILTNSRSSLSLKDKGVCNSVNSIIQTWRHNLFIVV